jgi:biotin transport system substrate-specific component
MAAIRSLRATDLPASAGFALLAVGLSLVLAASARISVPFWPVPMTLQTLAVLTIGGLAGPRLAGTALLLYVIEGACGLPVFAGTPERGIGFVYLAGPTGGYLAGMLLAAPLVGWLLGRSRGGLLATAGAVLAGPAVIYVCGVAWLAGIVGAERALVLGVLPFVAGEAMKIALATALILAGGRLRRA